MGVRHEMDVDHVIFGLRARIVAAFCGADAAKKRQVRHDSYVGRHGALKTVSKLYTSPTSK